MSKNTLRYLVVIAVLAVAGWGMVRLFSHWQDRVPKATHAATEVLGHPYLADRDTLIFHRRRCRVIDPRGGRGTYSKKPQLEHMVGFESRADAFEAGYYPCEECDP